MIKDTNKEDNNNMTSVDINKDTNEDRGDDREGCIADHLKERGIKNGYINEENWYKYSNPTSIEINRTESFPESFDPRPQGISKIKEQVLATCWAYSTIAAIESNLIKKGYADKSVDLSELQMIYFMNHQNIDPLGNYSNDITDTADSLSDLLNKGGSSSSAVSFLSKWTGPVLEEQAPLNRERFYDPISGIYNYTALDNMALGQDLCANSSNWHFKGAKFCDYDRDDRNHVKKMIRDYGGVCASCYSSDSAKYYQFLGEGKDISYYYPYKAASNHGVELIGWDDNYPRDNFSITPNADGAWLVKNSWGSEIVDTEGVHGSGFFWISYYDKTICDIVAVDYDTKDTYANMYAYDGGNGPGGTIKSDVCNLAVYTAKAYGEGKAECIDGIMTYLSRDSKYELTIYLNPVIMDGKLVGYSGKSATISGMSDYEGFYTIDISSLGVYVPNGKTYGILIKTDKKGGLGWALDKDRPMNCTFHGDSIDSLLDCSQKNENDCYTYGTPCLRGLTNPMNNVVLSTLIALKKDTVFLKEGLQENLIIEDVTPENVTNKTCSYYSTNESVATVDDSGLISAVGYGECDIMVSAYDGMSSASCHVVVYCTSISLSDTSLLINEKKTMIPQFKEGYTGITNRQLIWTSSDNNIVSVNSDGVIEAKNNGEAIIQAKYQDTKFTNNVPLIAECKITVKKSVESIQTLKDSYIIYTGEHLSLNPTVLPMDASNKVLKFKTDFDGINLDQSGNIIGLHKGNGSVIIQSTDGSGIEKMVKIKVLPSAEAITIIGPNDNTLMIGETKDILFSIQTLNFDCMSLISGETSDTSVCQIVSIRDNSAMDWNYGVLTIRGIKRGECTLTLKSKDGIGASLKIHVTVIEQDTPKTEPDPNIGPKTDPGAKTINPEVKEQKELPSKLNTASGIYHFKGAALILYKAKAKKTITIPSYVKYKGKRYKVIGIADKAFYKNKELNKVTLGGSVTSIGNKAFYGCKSLKQVVIPVNVTYIGDRAFYKCSSLNYIKIKTLKLSHVGKSAFKKISSKAVLKVPKKKIKAYKKLLSNKHSKGVTIR